MTCVNCRFQWCWLCEGEYRYNHYEKGTCKGLQFFQGDKLECCRNTFGLHKIFKCVYPNLNGPIEELNKSICIKYLGILGFWIFGFFVVYCFPVVSYFVRNMNKYVDDDDDTRLISLIILIGLCLFITFQIPFSALITPFILISLIYHKFFDKLLLFFGIGEFDDN